MKKISILLLTALSCSVAFLSCGFQNLQAPKEVVVRTDATYEFSVMNFDSEKEGSKLKISNYFDFGKTLEEKSKESADSSNMKVYKYNNGSQYQQYLIHMPLKEVEFDFAESFKNMEFSKAMESFKIDKEFNVPAIAAPERHEPIDLRDVHTQINKGVKFGGTTGTNVPVTFQTVSGQCDFNEITYASGYLIVSGVGLTGTVQLKNGSTSWDPVSFQNGEAKIPLTNKTISKTGMTIVFSDTGKTFGAEVHEDSRMKNASRITLDGPYAPTVNIRDITFPFSLSGDIKECTVTNGELEVKIDRPGAWASVITAYTIDLSGGMTASFSETKDKETLTNKPLTNGNIIAHSSVTTVINDATLDFETGPEVYAKVTITEVTARIKLNDDYETTITKNDPVSSDITDYVNKIEWNESGFDVIAINKLPAGNDIPLKFNSTFFDMTDVSTPIIAQGDAAIETTYEYRGDQGAITIFDPTKTSSPSTPTNDPDYFTTIPVRGDIELPDYQESNGEKTFKVIKVTPGKTYQLNITVKPAFDWKEAYVKTTKLQTNMKNAINTGMNRNTLFASLGEQFAEKMKIKTIPSYLYINAPEKLLQGREFKGIIRAFYGEANPTPDTDPKYLDVDPKQETYLIGEEATYDTVPNSSNQIPDFTLNDNGEVTYTAFGNQAFDFAYAMNMYSQAGTLCLDYDVKLSDGSGSDDDIKIEPQDLEKDTSTIKMDVVMILTMDFNLQDTISIDMLKLAKKSDSDLLGRSEASSNETIEKFLSVVQTATLNIDDFKLPMTGDVSLAVDMYKNGNKVEKPVGSGETYSLEVNPLTLIQTYPLQPDVQFVIGKPNQTSNFGILRTMPISGKIRLRIEADGDIPVYSNKD